MRTPSLLILILLVAGDALALPPKAPPVAPEKAPPVVTAPAGRWVREYWQDRGWVEVWRETTVTTTTVTVPEVAAPRPFAREGSGVSIPTTGVPPAVTSPLPGQGLGYPVVPVPNAGRIYTLAPSAQSGALLLGGTTENCAPGGG